MLMAAALLFKRSRSLVQNKVSLLLGIGGSRSTTTPPPLINHHRFRYSSSQPFVASSTRYESSKAQAQLEDFQQHDDQVIDFPGGKVAFTSEMRFISDTSHKRVPCYRVLDDNGELMTHTNHVQVSKELAVRMYSEMVTLQTMDSIFYEVQRQGRISFYLTSMGEEAVNIASAAALSSDDIILPQYREPGVLLWRGFTLQQIAHQCFGNTNDLGKGRQMPIHYGSNKHNYFTVSSPIATQLPQAVGAAYSLKMDGKNACAVTFCGDGATSEGDFHAGMNFAAVMEAPVIFIIRNNGWAISTPVEDQFRSDGIVVKGQAYGIWSIRVDGNDALAVYSAVHTAREIAIKEQRPVLIEALSYRVGHHSTSDDSTKYRPIDEIEYWKMERSPVNRFKRWVERNGWWSDKDELELRSSVRKQLMHAIQVAEKAQKPPLEDLFTDVYDQLSSNLEEQEKLLRKAIEKHPKDYPSDVPL
ncbi:2-oxoisovalerate dehydrogenase subunit alpha 1, mitochondrial-like isoform X2 [Trifolium pratense]|uniref:2-oxoisovalerate dehydrogenase subunit alpha 1, mitochondrial-like isoform X2 n=1 Tax=Trifolium pratense TaxID=57577 RepID=UPI001E69487A|nr:2-oxoisovalerate dehydrogenase subunit alpha 1, mitochondrial-like isoform X2 [Trifolium pratense]